MKRKIIGLLMILIWGVSCFAVYGEVGGADALWLKAVDLATRNQNWVPGETHMYIEEFNSKGKVEKTQETRVRYVFSDKGAPETEIITQKENGRDISAKSQGKQKAKQEQSITASLSDFNPFEPVKQKNITVKRKNVSKMAGGQKRIAYQYRLKQDDGSAQMGTAWLDEAGIPLELEYTLEPLPRFVRRMTYQVYYQFTPDGSWYPNEVRFEVWGKAFFKTIHVRNHLVFQGLCRYNPKK